MVRRKKNWIVIIVVVIAVITCLFYIIQQQTPLPGYTDTDADATATPTPTSTVDLTTYTDETTGLTMGIPLDWKGVIKGGNQMFVHSASASSIQIIVEDYYPQINNVTADTAAANLSAKNMSLTDFYWIDNSTYACMYQEQNDNENILDYIELVYYDREHIVTIQYIVPDQYYTKLQNIVSATVDSISWNRPSPIDARFRLYYNEFGDFEFATPINWTSAIQNSVYYAQDETTGATLSVAVQEYTDDFSNVSQLDYMNIVASGKNNFMLSSYNADNSVIYGAGSYTYNDEQIMFVQYMMANGAHQYVLTFECPASTYANVTEIINESVKYFRIFEQVTVSTPSEPTTPNETATEEAESAPVVQETQPNEQVAE